MISRFPSSANENGCCCANLAYGKSAAQRDGAGEGNRTLVFSLEGCCSTIELHPREGSPNTPGGRPQPAPCSCYSPLKTALLPRHPAVSGPLTGADSPPILVFPSTQRKEVIQCLLRSAVTSLGSPARPLSLRPGIGALSALDQRAQELERGGSHPAALSCSAVY